MHATCSTDCLRGHPTWMPRAPSSTLCPAFTSCRCYGRHSLFTRLALPIPFLALQRLHTCAERGHAMDGAVVLPPLSASHPKIHRHQLRRPLLGLTRPSPAFLRRRSAWPPVPWPPRMPMRAARPTWPTSGLDEQPHASALALGCSPTASPTPTTTTATRTRSSGEVSCFRPEEEDDEPRAAIRENAGGFVKN